VRRATAFLIFLGCAHALQKQPPPLESTVSVPHAPSAQFLAEADAAWARRAEPGQAAAAEQLYLLAARADPHNPESFAGAIRAKSFRLGREKNAAERSRLAQDAVAVGQLCEENQPAAATCDYWLAAALGLQARERAATAHDAMSLMVDLLRRAARNGVSIDYGGPHRLLAILLLRAPGWPLGPGDPETALPEAQSAARIAPEYPPNQLALGEALQKNGRTPEARSAYSEALRLATAETASADPDAAGWADEARAGLR
jgi:tetratricopeptide (TPR) repeat protein